ncbi:hypothetical protein LINGRAHAP2_LOCUS21806, partial [Linum grandiflorum]
MRNGKKIYCLNLSMAAMPYDFIDADISVSRKGRKRE